MSKTIRPIETEYKGYRFRSRLEARWAVFFDALGIDYDYELQGYELGDGIRYLPDFWLPQVSMWAEVKPTELTEEELIKVIRLAYGTGYPVLLLVGVPTDHPYAAIEAMSNCDREIGDRVLTSVWEHGEYKGDLQKFVRQKQEFYQGWYISTYCLTNYHDYPQDEGRFYSNPGGEEDSHWDDTKQAVIAARRARFEFGEHG